jgi:hypothetical protein
MIAYRNTREDEHWAVPTFHIAKTIVEYVRHGYTFMSGLRRHALR